MEKIENIKKHEGENELEKITPILNYLQSVNDECAALFKDARNKFDEGKDDIGINSYVARAKIIQYMPESLQKLLDEADLDDDIKNEIIIETRKLSNRAINAIENGGPTKLSMIIGPFGNSKNELEELIDKIEQK